MEICWLRARRAIGVSNYGVHHLQELLAVCKVRPAVNQIEISPYLTREELSAFCRREGIFVEAYSPLTKGMLALVLNLLWGGCFSCSGGMLLTLRCR